MIHLDPPVEKLLHLGDPPEWPDYRSLGITEADVPALREMATSRALLASDGNAGCAPMHAWQALAQLGVTAAIPDLIGMFVETDVSYLISEDLPNALVEMGPQAIEPLFAFIGRRDVDANDRLAPIETLVKLAHEYPVTRNAIVSRLTEQLSHYRVQDRTLNGFVVMALVELKALESMPVIERAFAEDAVDLTVIGDIEDVQVELGLLAVRRTPKPHYAEHEGIATYLDPRPVEPMLARLKSQPSVKQSKKARNKVAKASKRRNRRNRRK